MPYYETHGNLAFNIRQRNRGVAKIVPINMPTMHIEKELVKNGCTKLASERKQYIILKEELYLDEDGRIITSTPEDDSHIPYVNCDIPLFAEINQQNESDDTYLNIGFSAQCFYTKKIKDFQNNNKEEMIRHALSLQFSIVLGNKIIRYFFLVKPKYQIIKESGGKVPLSYVIADILYDLNCSHGMSFPCVRCDKIDKKIEDGKEYFDFSKMKKKGYNIPFLNLISDKGLSDLTIFRRSKFDKDILDNHSTVIRRESCTSLNHNNYCASKDNKAHKVFPIKLQLRDVASLIPQNSVSPQNIADFLQLEYIPLSYESEETIDIFASRSPLEYYKYVINKSDLIVCICSALFNQNRYIPITLAHMSWKYVYNSLFAYFQVDNDDDYNRIYRGIEKGTDELNIKEFMGGINYLRNTELMPIKSNPFAEKMTIYFEKSYHNSICTAFNCGFIDEITKDFDLQSAYLSSSACVADIDWKADVITLSPAKELTIDNVDNPLIEALLDNPLTPSCALIDFEFPDNVYCPSANMRFDGVNFYPQEGENVHVLGIDIYTALKLGAKITIHDGFIAKVLKTNKSNSYSLTPVMRKFVRSRIHASNKYGKKSLVVKLLKQIGVDGYGKVTSGLRDSKSYSCKITSPYHASYITAIVRNYLIALINQIVERGYKVYSVAYDGLITNAPEELLYELDAYGLRDILQTGRCRVTNSYVKCDETQLIQCKHINDKLLNITSCANVGNNPEGVLAHGSYKTGAVEDSMRDREIFVHDVLLREGKLSYKYKGVTGANEILEKKADFFCYEGENKANLNFDYKRVPIINTMEDIEVDYKSSSGEYDANAFIANFETRPFKNIEEFKKYRTAIKNEPKIKTKEDFERIRIKALTNSKCHITDLKKTILLTILKGYRMTPQKYAIPALDGLSRKDIIEKINSWSISKIKGYDWDNCRNPKPETMLEDDFVEEIYLEILDKN